METQHPADHPRLAISGAVEPRIDKAKRLSSFADDAWQRMACIETANVLDDAVVLQPGQQHLLSVSVTAIPRAE